MRGAPPIFQGKRPENEASNQSSQKALFAGVVYSYFEKGVLGKGAHDWSPKALWVVLSAMSLHKFERMVREAVDICLWVLKESNKSRFNTYSVGNSTSRDCRVHIFPTAFLEQEVQLILKLIWSTDPPGTRYIFQSISQKQNLP